MATNLSRTLEQLEATRWPDPPADSTPLVLKCHALRRVPVEQLSAGGLRTLIGQGIAVRILLPLAIEMLRRDPVLEADYYPGDLLVAVMRTPVTELQTVPGAMDTLHTLASVAKSRIAGSESGASRQLLKDIHAFEATSAA